MNDDKPKLLSDFDTIAAEMETLQTLQSYASQRRHRLEMELYNKFGIIPHTEDRTDEHGDDYTAIIGYYVRYGFMKQTKTCPTQREAWIEYLRMKQAGELE